MVLTELLTVWEDLLASLEIAALTEVQEALYEPLSAGKSVLATSPTGTGKTLAYLLPLLTGLEKGRAQQLLILAPSSELAAQIHEVTAAFAAPLGLSSQLILSGASLKRQMERLKKGPEILVATPGRALELVVEKKIKMMNFRTIVLDEADQLLEEGQWRFVKPIVTRVAKEYQLVFLSATAYLEREAIKELVSADLMEIEISDKPTAVAHFYVRVEQRKKIDFLRQLAHLPKMRALVFFNRLADLDVAESKLLFQNLPVGSLASDQAAAEKKRVLKSFKQGDLSLLLVTDLLARGIDIPRLEWVVHFEPAPTSTSYLHRAGRTGRMGASGKVLTLVSTDFELKQLKRYHREVSEKVLHAQQFLDRA